jgi:type IV pilus assembly protein PilV
MEMKMFPDSSPALARSPKAQRGTTLLEVLVTLIILAIGLLGLAGLQMRLQASEMEAYQRAQALILLNDMASRVAANRVNAASYKTGTPLGAGMACPTASATRQEADAAAWCDALQGAGESLGGSNVGTMVGGRGCVEQLNSTDFMVTVAWQGLTPISAPPDSVTCGAGEYDGGSGCVEDLCRRAVTTIVRIGNLAI